VGGNPRQPYRTTDGGKAFVAAGTGIDLTNAPIFARLEKCPANDDVIVAGTDNLWRTNNFFSAPTPTWASNSPEMGAGVLGQITGLAFAPSDGTCNTYAFGTTGGQLRLTVNGGTTSRSTRSPTGLWRSHLAAALLHYP
jgi:hypothetical protein